ncbi:PFL family protein [Methylophaga pinxianii]|uniref:PFL family protein n=1 Tax=Methylophaga pinxianii TaxID=2881052 RepID=UPI001CF35601|nr:PFL family protein [Methylophaga pinxianii]MCB2427972.1 PFL family protein [Methylophaga pinxianii]UPH44462.1 PFL family protein [Methylophaga pinxianii]
MLNEKDIISTLMMVREQNLDLRTVTVGINLTDCVSHDLETFKRKIYDKITRYAGQLVASCNRIERRYGIEVANKRISISPIGVVGAPFSSEQLVEVAITLDKAAHELGVDFIGGFSALVEKGMSKGDQALIDAIPQALTQTQRICSSVNVASTRAGINMDAILKMGQIIKQSAELTAADDGLAAAKLVVFANIPQDVPFMAGAYLGIGEADAVVSVGVSGPGVVKAALEKALAEDENMDLSRAADIIKQTAARLTRAGELVGREVAQLLNLPFGIVDLSLAPTPNRNDSVGEIFEAIGLPAFGAPGSTAFLSMLNDAVKKGGAFASSHVGGLSGAFIPVCEDLTIAESAANGTLSLEKLEAMTAVCSVGLDMVAIPGDTSAEMISAIIADEMAIGVINKKTTAARLIPAPGKKAGDIVRFGGLLGEGPVMAVNMGSHENRFVRLGGRIPAPIQSLVN